MMTLDTINLEDVGKYEGLVIYEYLCQAYVWYHYIDTSHSFWVGLFIEATRRRQENMVYLFGTLRGDILEDWTWVEDIIYSTNLLIADIADIEAQGVSKFSEWKEHVQAAVGQVKAAEISVKNLQQW